MTLLKHSFKNKTALRLKKDGFSGSFKRQVPILLLLIPCLAWYLVFKYLPLAGITFAFTDFGFKPDVSFIGLENFRRLFASMDFTRAFINTLLISFYNIVFYFPLPIFLAILMNEIVRVKLKRLIQFLVYIPHFFSWVVVGGLFVTLLSPTSGFVNDVIKALGFEPVYFMASPKWFRSILVTSHIWRDVGYGTVIYIATIATIDPELYSAAVMDGANRWQQTLHVTLPNLKSTIATVLLLSISNILKIFEQVLIMYNSAVKEVSDVLWTYSFSEGLINGDIGYATAIGLFTSVISFILVFSVNKVSEKFLDESIL